MYVCGAFPGIANKNAVAKQQTKILTKHIHKNFAYNKLQSLLHVLEKVCM